MRLLLHQIKLTENLLAALVRKKAREERVTGPRCRGRVPEKYQVWVQSDAQVGPSDSERMVAIG